MIDFDIIKNDIQKIKEYFKKNEVFSCIKKNEELIQKSDFWDNPSEAQRISSELSSLQKLVKTWEEIEKTYNNIQEMQEILSEEEIEFELKSLSKIILNAKIDLFLSNKYDDCKAIITLTVGAGGVDANDWTKMVFEMLLKYCERNNWKTQILDIQEADVAGIKGATFRVLNGSKIYGHLKSENGTHRLVRRSPFNAGNTRETSFANVEVVPEIKSDNEVNIDEKDIRIDTFRSQGAGGQHVNTTDSAVRITHFPSGIVVQCQNERSQHQNKEQAMKVLKSRLADKKRKEEEEQKNALKSDKVHASFGGGHIRSYVLDDRYVKDVRTGLKTSKVDNVLAGELDEFIENYIFWIS